MSDFESKKPKLVESAEDHSIEDIEDNALIAASSTYNSQPDFDVGTDGENRGYKIITAETIFNDLINLVNQTKEIIQVPTSTLMILLDHVNWDRDRLLEAYYEDEEKLMKDAKATIQPEILSQSSVVGTLECEICCETVQPNEYSGLQCGHRFCNECWTAYLVGQIMDEGTSRGITCPASDCSAIVEYDLVRARINDKAIILRYQQLITKYFVQSNRHLRWCPAPGCDKAISVDVLKWILVTCSCGKSFCFVCGKSWHEPVRCDLLARWLKKCGDDSETATWMQANTKDCPKCKTRIEKNGGCNHITCRIESCRFEFCWICLRDWKDHTGDAYHCNKFNESEQREVSEARLALERYLHFYNRYRSHMQSLRFETKLMNSVQSKMDFFQEEMNMSYVEVQFFKTAAETLCRCRNTLLNTYAFAYFLEKSNQSEMFEDNQRDLESATETLSGYLEKEFEESEAAPVNPIAIKQKIVDSSAYCESRRVILIQHVHDGYDESFWIYRQNISDKKVTIPAEGSN